MPTISNDNKNQSVKEMEDHLIMASHMQAEPTVVVGVNRKVNIGNFENVDVYVGVTLPISREALSDFDSLKAAISDVAGEGIRIASEETADRYYKIKQQTSS